jgi:FixJ family two-component response regulator
MMEPGSVVFVIDDDAAIRDALGSLIRSIGLGVETFRSPADFLKSEPPKTRPSCLVLDVRLPGTSGLDFQRRLAEANLDIPIIFITGHGDVQMSVRAMKAGAIDFLTKPFRDQDLIDAIQASLEKDRARRDREMETATLRERFESLTRREQEIVPWIITGKPNKQIAAAIGATEATVKVHRSQLMRKMGAESVVALVRIADKLRIAPAHPKHS